MKNKPRLLVVQPNLNPPGGAGLVATFALETLRDEYEIQVLTWEPAEWATIDRFYGTTLSDTHIVTHGFSRALRRIVAFDPDPDSFQRVGFLVRCAKRMCTAFDFTLSFCDEMDLGGRGLQYIHYPWLENLYHELNAPQSLFHTLRLRYRPLQLISDFSFARMKQNVTLVNSDWIGARVQKLYGISTTTVYPPVATNALHAAWDTRENGFLCIGRISPEKRLEVVIEILARVRARGYAIHLHLVGTRARNAPSYYYEIRNLVQAHAEWIQLHENISRTELNQMLAAHRYGIHGHAQEHFGLAVAEMVCGGCIVFVPNDGGQVEIVGGEPRLLYASPEEAVEKIARVLQDENAQTELRAALAARAAQFSVERFMQKVRAVVAQELDKRS